jgi:hypothetical protein
LQDDASLDDYARAYFFAGDRKTYSDRRHLWPFSANRSVAAVNCEKVAAASAAAAAAAADNWQFGFLTGG